MLGEPAHTGPGTESLRVFFTPKTAAIEAALELKLVQAKGVEGVC